MSKLWQKSDSTLHPLVETYIIGDELAADELLLPFDVDASIAHAQMLVSTKLLDADEAAKITDALRELKILHAEGKFAITLADEDVHTAIENYLVSQLGDLGKKIHVGRSRNDQVLVAMRLFTKDRPQWHHRPITPNGIYGFSLC